MRIYNPEDRTLTFVRLKELQDLNGLVESHERNERLMRILGPQALMEKRLSEVLGSDVPGNRPKLELLAAETRLAMLAGQKPMEGWQVNVVDRAHAEVLAKHELVKRVESTIERYKVSHTQPRRPRVVLGVRIKDKPRSKISTTVRAIRVASVLGYVLPTGYAEEWIGDLHEASHQLGDKGYPRWAQTAITLGRVLLFIWSLVRIKTDLLVGKRYQRRE